MILYSIFYSSALLSFFLHWSALAKVPPSQVDFYKGFVCYRFDWKQTIYRMGPLNQRGQGTFFNEHTRTFAEGTPQPNLMSIHVACGFIDKRTFQCQNQSAEILPGTPVVFEISSIRIRPFQNFQSGLNFQGNATLKIRNYLEFSGQKNSHVPFDLALFVHCLFPSKSGLD